MQRLRLRRADRHAAGRGRERARAQAVRRRREKVAQRHAKTVSRRADDDRVMRRIEHERPNRLRIQTAQQTSASASPAGRSSRRTDGTTLNALTTRAPAVRAVVLADRPAAAVQARHAAARSPRPQPRSIWLRIRLGELREARSCLAVGLQAARMRKGADRKLRVEQLQQPQQSTGRASMRMVARRAAVKGRRAGRTATPALASRSASVDPRARRFRSRVTSMSRCRLPIRCATRAASARSRGSITSTSSSAAATT